MNRAYLGLGGNLGDPEMTMRNALALLASTGSIDVITVSSLYLTPPWGNTEQPPFLNAVAEIETTTKPLELLELCLEVELKLDRVRAERWGPRTIDIDILIYDDLKVNIADRLVVPHPRLKERAFALIPLAEIAPNLELEGKLLSVLIENIPESEARAVETGKNWWRLPAA